MCVSKQHLHKHDGVLEVHPPGTNEQNPIVDAKAEDNYKNSIASGSSANHMLDARVKVRAHVYMICMLCF